MKKKSIPRFTTKDGQKYTKKLIMAKTSNKQSLKSFLGVLTEPTISTR
jgi:hypothetical protein